MSNYGGVVLGATTGAAVVLPNTGGNLGVVEGVALASIGLGLAVLVSAAIRMASRRGI